MPTVAREHGLRFVIFTADHPPPHVHVSGRGSAKIALVPPFASLAEKGMSAADIARARNVVSEQAEQMMRVWVHIHGAAD